jgi:25S rRNA (adenine2142-N1)-methyltransferase
MGIHRKTIRRKKPLTQINGKGMKRREAIKLLHKELKSSQQSSRIPLSVYQQASSKGQDTQHGGDSSKVLVPWLKNSSSKGIRVLEIGSLEVDNAIARLVHSRNGSIRRLDLKSRDPRIEEQDFMSLDIPTEVVRFKRLS